MRRRWWCLCWHWRRWRPCRRRWHVTRPLVMSPIGWAARATVRVTAPAVATRPLMVLATPVTAFIMIVPTRPLSTSFRTTIFTIWGMVHSPPIAVELITPGSSIGRRRTRLKRKIKKKRFIYKNIFILFSGSNMENVVPVSMQRCEKNYQKSSEQISPVKKLIKIPRRSKNAKKWRKLLYPKDIH